MPVLFNTLNFTGYSIIQMLLLAHCLFRADHVLFIQIFAAS